MHLAHANVEVPLPLNYLTQTLDSDAYLPQQHRDCGWLVCGQAQLQVSLTTKIVPKTREKIFFCQVYSYNGA